MKRIVGTKDDNSKVDNIKEGEILLINISSTSCGGTVMKVAEKQARILLTKHVCANIDGKIALSRKIDRNFRLIGWGVIKQGYERKNR